MERNILLTLEYDGSLFHGWQEQQGLRTVQGTLQEALGAVLGHEVKVAGTSRTDAGVHALGQCCSFRTGSAIPEQRLPEAVNNMLAGGRTGAGSKVADVRVISAREVPEDFHARFDCRGKTYRYLIRTGAPDIFRRNHIYYIDCEPDVELMRLAAEQIVGTHDFRCFMAAGGNPGNSTVRTVSSLEISETVLPYPTKHERRSIPGEGRRPEGGARFPGGQGMPMVQAPVFMPAREIAIEITGDGFLYNMVRIIAGTLIEAGLGKRTPESIRETIDSLDRANAGHTAPPWGLYLKEIYFD